MDENKRKTTLGVQNLAKAAIEKRQARPQTAKVVTPKKKFSKPPTADDIKEMKFSEIAERTATSKMSMGAKGKPEVLNAVRVASALTTQQVSKRSEILTK